MRKYEGIRNPTSQVVDVSVISYRLTPHGVEYDVRPARPLRHIPMHSPSGFEWAYNGSGPADLALAILADHFGERRMTVDQIRRGVGSRAWDLHQFFKAEIVASLPKSGWSLNGDEVSDWVNVWLGKETEAVS